MVKDAAHHMRDDEDVGNRGAVCRQRELRGAGRELHVIGYECKDHVEVHCRNESHVKINGQSEDHDEVDCNGEDQPQQMKRTKSTRRTGGAITVAEEP